MNARFEQFIHTWSKENSGLGIVATSTTDQALVADAFRAVAGHVYPSVQFSYINGRDSYVFAKVVLAPISGRSNGYTHAYIYSKADNGQTDPEPRQLFSFPDFSSYPSDCYPDRLAPVSGMPASAGISQARQALLIDDEESFVAFIRAVYEAFFDGLFCTMSYHRFDHADLVLVAKNLGILLHSILPVSLRDSAGFIVTSKPKMTTQHKFKITEAMSGAKFCFGDRPQKEAPTMVSALSKLVADSTGSCQNSRVAVLAVLERIVQERNVSADDYKWLPVLLAGKLDNPYYSAEAANSCIVDVIGGKMPIVGLSVEALATGLKAVISVADDVNVLGRLFDALVSLRYSPDLVDIIRKQLLRRFATLDKKLLLEVLQRKTGEYRQLVYQDFVTHQLESCFPTIPAPIDQIGTVRGLSDLANDPLYSFDKTEVVKRAAAICWDSRNAAEKDSCYALAEKLQGDADFKEAIMSSLNADIRSVDERYWLTRVRIVFQDLPKKMQGDATVKSWLYDYYLQPQLENSGSLEDMRLREALKTLSVLDIQADMQHEISLELANREYRDQCGQMGLDCLMAEANNGGKIAWAEIGQRITSDSYGFAQEFKQNEQVFDRVQAMLIFVEAAGNNITDIAAKQIKEAFRNEINSKYTSAPMLPAVKSYGLPHAASSTRGGHFVSDSGTGCSQNHSSASSYPLEPGSVSQGGNGDTECGSSKPNIDQHAANKRSKKPKQNRNRRVRASDLVLVVMLLAVVAVALVVLLNVVPGIRTLFAPPQSEAPTETKTAASLNAASSKVTLQHAWIDGNNEANIRPQSVTVIVKDPVHGSVSYNIGFTDGASVDSGIGLNDNIWTQTIDLASYYEDGRPIEYSVTVILPGEDYIAGRADDDTVIVPADNDCVASLTSVLAITIRTRVTWDDSSNVGGTRPSTLSIDVLANNTSVSGSPFLVSPSSLGGVMRLEQQADSWVIQGMFPKYDDAGSIIVYSVFVDQPGDSSYVFSPQNAPCIDGEIEISGRLETPGNIQPSESLNGSATSAN
jgi:hypothetical protein